MPSWRGVRACGVNTAFPYGRHGLVSRQHGGETIAENLAFACMVCNRFKGTNLTSISPSGDFVRLFNPRLEGWHCASGLKAIIQPLSAIGEVTTRLLRLNTADRVGERAKFQQLGRYPRASD